MQVLPKAALLDRCFTAFSMTDGDFLREMGPYGKWDLTRNGTLRKPGPHETTGDRQSGGGRVDNKKKASQQASGWLIAAE